MEVINTNQKTKKTAYKPDQEALSSFVTFRVTNAELEQLKDQAKADKRNLSNFIHSKLF